MQSEFDSFDIFVLVHHDHEPFQHSAADIDLVDCGWVDEMGHVGEDVADLTSNVELVFEEELSQSHE